MNEIEAGALLHAKREEAGLTLADIADKLNVSEDTVRKLEEGQHEQLPGRVFVRGYIRYYAKLLNIDATTLFKDEDVVVEETGDDLDYAQDETALSMTRRWGTVAIVVVLLLVIYSWWVEDEPPPPPPIDIEEPAPSPPETMEEPAVTPPQPEASTPTATTEEPPVSTTAKTILEAFAEVRLQTGRYESWVQVTDADGDILIERLLGPYSESRVYGTAPFNFRVGFVRDVTLSINGEVYPFSHLESRGMAVFVAP